MTELKAPVLETKTPDIEIDIGYLLAVFKDNLYLILSVAFVVIMVGVSYILLATPIYRADALLQVEQRDTSVGSIELTTIGEESSTTQSEILQSRLILGQAAAQAGLDLAVEPVYFPVIGKALARLGVDRPAFAQGWSSVWAGESIEVTDFGLTADLEEVPLTVQILDENRYRLMTANDEVLGEGRSDEFLNIESPFIQIKIAELNAPPGAEFTVRKRSSVGMTQYLKSRFTVAARRDTGILNLALVGEDVGELVRSLDAIADVYVMLNINRQAAEAESRLKFLEEQTPLVLQELTDAEDVLNAYRATQESVDLSFETQTMLERIVKLDSQLNELQFQESELAQRFTPSHPAYMTLRDRRAHIVAERDQLEAEVDVLPETQRQILRLNRDVQVNQQIYMQMLNTIQELRIAKAGTIGNVRILDRALAGERIAPQRSLILLASTVGGLLLGLGLVFLRQLLHRGIESIDQIHQATGMQVYAAIPLSDAQAKLNQHLRPGHKKKGGDIVGGVLASIDPADLAVEALRSLRTSLHFAMLEAPNNRLMLTGPSPSVGKTFVSANLAAVCSLSGQKVLLVDADLRKGHIHHAFNGQGADGLSDLLIGRIDLAKAIRHTKIEGLDYVARGVVPPNPSELLMTQKFTQFLDEVSTRYDLVIIDTPPVLAVTDAAIVGKQVGSTFMVVRFKENSLKELDRANQQLDNAGIRVKGAVLNAIDRSATAYYGYGYYHYAYKSSSEKF